MKLARLLIAPLAFFLLFSVASEFISPSLAEEPKLDADSKKQDGVPEGEVAGPFEWRSKIYPGTVRNYWVYVPKQYDKAKPACSIFVQDGMGRAKNWRLPTVMDNLIHKGEMPVTIGIFIDHGKVPPTNESAQPRFNRSFEYDGLGDRYARFLLDEIIPEVSKTYNLSDDPNDRAIAGASSGGICAFTAAWERPDAFRRVLCTIGTFVGLRGGNEYPTLVRKTEPKPIRIFMQDGSNDLNIYAGDWWMANQDMLSALKYSGYDVKHVWGEGGHDNSAVKDIPDALRWLWRDYPEPIVAPVGKGKKRRNEILIPGEEWELVSEGHKFTEGPAINSDGEVFFTDIPNNKIHKIAVDGTVSEFAGLTSGTNGLMFAADGFLYACQNKSKEIVRYSPDGEKESFLSDSPSNDLIVLANGTGYYTDPTNKKVWHVDADGFKTLADEGIAFPNGVIATADQDFLLVSDTRSRVVYSFQIQTDGSLKHKQEYGYLHLPADGTGNNSDSGADGMTVDTEGRTYVTTKLGVQVLDQLGRVHLIIAKPQNAWLSNCIFGGPNLDVLYATCGDKVYKRKLNAKGVIPWQEPVKPPKPGL